MTANQPVLEDAQRERLRVVLRELDKTVDELPNPATRGATRGGVPYQDRAGEIVGLLRAARMAVEEALVRGRR
jgi:hypothetical protein